MYRTFALSIALAIAAPEALRGAPAATAQSPQEQAALDRAHELSAAFQWATRTIAPSVVNIVSTQQIAHERVPEGLERFFGSPPRSFEARGEGSGVIVRADGHILTNLHVVGEGSDIQVTLANGRTYPAQVIGADRETDLALIRIDADNLQAANFGDSDLLEVGQWVLAVGNPFGLDHTVTAGIISALGREAMGLSVYGNFIQTDAAINPGNSGGPLINLRGEVVGINNAITTQTGGYMGIGFAIPGNMAESVLQSLLSNGTVVRGWLGVTMEPLTPQRAEVLGYEGEGVLVREVSESSPAARAGLKVGDIVTQLDGLPMRTMTQLQNSVARRTPGTVVRMAVIRDGRPQSVDVTLGKRPPLPELLAAQEGQQYFGGLEASGREVTPEVARERGLSVDRGVVILAVAEGGLAARLGLGPNDVILAFAGQRIDRADDLVRALEGFDPAGNVRIELQRGDTRLSLIVE